MIRAGVIGAGKMGAHHARAYASLAGSCVLAGVYDPDRTRAEEVTSHWGAQACASVDELIERCDVVSVASPSSLHLEHAALAIERSRDVLIEKPVALTVHDARMLERIASLRPHRPVVQVGHIEHFNPAIRELRKLLDGHDVVAVDMQRLGPFDGRIADADVVQDLMLHDVHVLLSLASSPVTEVQAAARAVRSADQFDYCVATLTFESGLIATLSASRVTENKIRRLSVTTSDAHVTVDSMQRTLELSRWTSLRATSSESAAYRQESVVERVFVPAEEPLVAQLRSFLDCARERRAPEVPLRMGTACLELVEAIRERAAAPAGALAPLLV